LQLNIGNIFAYDPIPPQRMDRRFGARNRVVDDATDFELRIIGHEIVQAYRENFTGRRMPPCPT
jgi:hypothetical protein